MGFEPSCPILDHITVLDLTRGAVRPDLRAPVGRLGRECDQD